jgi:hypothetical protein
MKKELLDEVVKRIIETSSDNTAGLIMGKTAISKAVRECNKRSYLDRDVIDDILMYHESYRGFLVKSSDFIAAYKHFKIDHLIF